MEDRRQGNADIQSAIARLEGGLDRLIHLLEGNGQPGFIAITRAQLTALQCWQDSHDKVSAERRRSQKNQITLWGLVVTIVLGVIHFLLDWKKP